MLANRNESRNFNAVSEINGEVIAGFNASYNTSAANLIFSKSITNFAKYMENQQAVEADYSEFQTGVIEEIGGVDK